MTENGENPIGLFKRFLDDIFIVWKGTIEELQTFLKEINSLHPTIKFTAEFTSPYRCDVEGPHDCFCHQTQSIPFLDTKVSISGGKLITDLYKKPTDRCQYLLPSSCHPSHITKNIPYNLAYRLLRICSERETLITRLDELKVLLLSRDYRQKAVEDAIKRVLEINREEAIKRIPKKKCDRTIIVLTYNPALPSVSGILQKHWRVMTQDPYLKKVFPSPPMVAFRRPKNLRDKLIKARVPPTPQQRTPRNIPGMKPCNGKNCETCPFVKNCKQFKGPFNDTVVQINSTLNCTSTNVVYCLQCSKENCKQIYIGETQRELKQRFAEHKTSVRIFSKNAVGEHFNGPGHSLADMNILAIEKVFTPGQRIIEKRESLWINKLEAHFQGLNRKK